MNPFIINPAVVGIENYWDLRLSHRHQWAGISGGPVSTYISIHGPLSTSEYPMSSATGVDIPGTNPRGKVYWEEYSTPPSHNGIGFTIVNDKFGPLDSYAASAAYAHHIKLGPRLNISAGISLGYKSLILNTERLVFYDANEPLITGIKKIKSGKSEVAAGLWLYSDAYFASLSVQNIIPGGIRFESQNLRNDGSSLVKLVPHLFATAGYRLWINEDINVIPSLMMKAIGRNLFSIDVNTRFAYRDFLWAATSCRIDDSVSLMFGANLNPAVSFTYSYDHTISSLNLVSIGSHEIVIGVLIGNKFKDTCPRNVW